jgi:hypothetical protein
MEDDFFMLATEDMLIGAFVAMAVILLLWMVATRRPDPKAALLLSLMADFPKEPEGEQEEPQPGDDEGEAERYPRQHEFFS